MMSGQKEPDRATTPAATSTPRLAITSLREHSTALDMFMSRDRKRQIRRRQKRFTASASAAKASISVRSEEHTSELQSLMRISYAVFCLKKQKTLNSTTKHHKPHLKHE